MFTPLLVALTIFFKSALAYEASAWYFLRYHLSSGSRLTSLSGELIVPHLNPANGGRYYIWPGLQTLTYGSVYQNVLSGNDSGVWAFFSGYCCDSPDLPWGGSFNAYEGETISFSNVENATSWTTVDRREKTGKVVTSDLSPLSKYSLQT